MGMDISGRNPVNDSGVYFRANVWSWRPIHELICKLGSDLMTDDILIGISGNDGKGPDSPEVCQKLADRLAIWLEHNVNGYSLDIGCHVLTEVNERGHQSFATREQAMDPTVDSESAHRVCDKHLQEFVTFLYNCGGFQVF